MPGFDLRQVFVEVTGDTSKARRELSKLRRDLSEKQKIARMGLELDGLEETQAKIAEVRRELLTLGRMKVSPEVRAKTAKAQAELSALTAKAAAAERTLDDLSSGRAKEVIRLRTEEAEAHLIRLRGEAEETQAALAKLRENDPDGDLIETKRAVDKLAKLRAQIRKTGKEIVDLNRSGSDSEIRLSTERAQKDLDLLRKSITKTKATLTDLGKSGPSEQVRVKTAAAQAELASLNARAARAEGFEVLQAKIEVTEALLEQLGRRTVTPEVTVKIARAEQQLAAFRAELEKTGTLDERIEVEIAGTEKALAEIAAINAALVALDGQDISPKVEIEVDRARRNLGELTEDVTHFRDRFIQAKEDARDGGLIDTGQLDRDAAAMRRVLGGVEREAGRVSGAFGAFEREAQKVSGELTRAEESAKSAGSTFNRFTRVLGFINPVLAGVSTVIVAQMIPALIAIVPAAIGAAAALGALVPAGLALGGALAAGAVGLVKSIGEINKVRQLREAAKTAEVRRGAEADKAAAVAARGIAAAQRQVRDATERRATAERNLSAARSDAASQIKDAQQQVVDSAANLRERTVDAYNAMRDAAINARDAVLDVRDAELGVSEASLATRQAEKALKEFTKSGGKSLEALGQKFKDVASNPKALAAAVRGARSSGVGADDADKLEELVLRVQRARLTEEQAANRVKKAENGLTDARKTSAEFAAKGIAAYGPYVDAQKTLVKAEEKYQDLLKVGVENSPQVVAAREALRDANQGIKDGEQALRDAVAQRQQMMAKDPAIEEYKKKLAGLTDEQKRLLAAMDGIKPALGKFKDAVSGPSLVQFAEILDDIAGSSESVLGWARQLGTIGGQNIKAFRDELKADPQWKVAMKSLGDESLKTAEILGGKTFRNFAEVFRNLAQAGLPLVNEGLSQFADSLGRAADGTRDVQKTQGFLRPLLSEAKAFARLFGRILALVVSFARAAEPAVKPFLDALSDIVKKTTAWVNSAKGQERIQQFFKTVLPTVLSFLKMIGKLVLLGAQLYEFFAPALKVIYDTISGVLGLLGSMLNFLNTNIPAGVRSLLALLIPIGAPFKLLFKLVGKIPGALGLITRGVGRILGAFSSIFPRIFGILEGAVGAFGSFGRLMAQALKAPFFLLKAAFKGIFRGIVAVAAGAWGGIKSVFGHVGDFFSRIFGGAVKAVESAFNGIVSLIKGAVNLLIDAANLLIKGLNKIHVKIPGWVPGFGGKTFGVPHIDEIPKLADGGIAQKSMLANIGEAGKEAVIPLRDAVLRKLGLAIAEATARRGAPATQAQYAAARGDLSAARGKIENLNVYPQVPAAQNPDPVWTAREIGRLAVAKG